MAIALISDIHSNIEALTSVLADIKEQGVKDIYCLGDIVGGRAEMRLQLVEPRFLGIALGEPRGAFQLGDEGVQCRALVVRRALVTQVRMALLGNAFAQHLGDARLSDPGLAGEQHRLAISASGLFPAIEQQINLVFIRSTLFSSNKSAEET